MSYASAIDSAIVTCFFDTQEKIPIKLRMCILMYFLCHLSILF